MNKILTLKSIRNIVALASLSLAAMALAQTTKPANTKPYTLQTCIVSGEKLGSMGDPVTYIYKDQEIKFCCTNCEADFKKDPDKYIKALEVPEKTPTTKPAAK